jgi:hypothetical protein
MGLFDAFKKKVEEKSEEINPLFELVKNANLNIENLQVVNNNGVVKVTGQVQNGEVINTVKTLVTAQNGVSGFENGLDIADVSRLGISYKVVTKSSNLNVRKGPGTDFEIVGKFPKDTEVKLVKRVNNEWFLVRSADLEGHCHTDYLDLI